MLKLICWVKDFLGYSPTQPQHDILAYRLTLNEFGAKLMADIQARFNPRRIHRFCRKRGFTLFEYAFKTPIYE